MKLTSSHPGEEFIYVLEGAIIAEIDRTEYLVKSRGFNTLPFNLQPPVDKPA